MKIVLLADASSIHTEKWIRGLQGHMTCEIDLITLIPSPPRAAIVAAIGSDHIHSLAPRSFKEEGGNFHYLLQIPALWRLLRRLKPDAINAIYVTSYGFLGALLKGRAKLCYYAIGTDILVTPKRNFVYAALTRFALWRADLIMSVSVPVGREIMGRFRIPPERVLVQHYGVESDVLDMQRPETRYTFVSNRAWVENSNIPMIIDSLTEFPKERAAVIGTPARGTEALGEKIRIALKDQPQIEEYGFLPYQKNLEMVAASRFLLSWTVSDGTPGSVMEAMAMGTIPIVSDTGPNREWIQDGINGVLVPLDDREARGFKLKAALRLSPDEISRMAAVNKRIVAERATHKTNMGRYVARMRGLFRD